MYAAACSNPGPGPHVRRAPTRLTAFVTSRVADVQQGAQAYTQQAGAGGQEGNGGMVPMAGMMSYGGMMAQGQSMQAGASGQEGQYSASYAMQPPQ